MRREEKQLDYHDEGVRVSEEIGTEVEFDHFICYICTPSKGT